MIVLHLVIICLAINVWPALKGLIYTCSSACPISHRRHCTGPVPGYPDLNVCVTFWSPKIFYSYKAEKKSIAICWELISDGLVSYPGKVYVVELPDMQTPVSCAINYIFSSNFKTNFRWVILFVKFNNKYSIFPHSLLR